MTDWPKYTWNGKEHYLTDYMLLWLFLCKLEPSVLRPDHTAPESPETLHNGNSCSSSLFSVRLLWTPSSQLKPKDRDFCINLDLATDLLHSYSFQLRKWGQRVKPPLSKIYPFRNMSACCDAWRQYLYRWISSLKNRFVCFSVDHSPCCNVSQLDPAPWLPDTIPRICSWWKEQRGCSPGSTTKDQEMRLNGWI